MRYPIELNDQPAVVYRRNTAAEYEEMLVDNFDDMLRRSEDAPLVYAISIHTFILGQPFRLSRFRRALQHMLKAGDAVWFSLPKELGAIPIPSFPLELQRTFAIRIQAVESLKATHRAALSELGALFASLQHRAFAGQLS